MEITLTDLLGAESANVLRLARWLGIRGTWELETLCVFLGVLMSDAETCEAYQERRRALETPRPCGAAGLTRSNSCLAQINCQ